MQWLMSRVSPFCSHERHCNQSASIPRGTVNAPAVFEALSNGQSARVNATQVSRRWLLVRTMLVILQFNELTYSCRCALKKHAICPVLTRYLDSTFSHNMNGSPTKHRVAPPSAKHSAQFMHFRTLQKVPTHDAVSAASSRTTARYGPYGDFLFIRLVFGLQQSDNTV